MRRAALLFLLCLPLAAVAQVQWQKEDGIRVKEGSVPFAYPLERGRYRLYFCGQGGIQSAVSNDGLAFTLEPGVRIAPTPGEGSREWIVCDPSLVKLDDGRYRMYYKGANGPGGPGQSIHRVFSAVSLDGITFVKEGLRLESEGTIDRGWASVPEVIRTFDGRWRMYYVSDAAEGHGIASALSDDGLNFTREPGQRIIGMVDPAVVTLPNGQYWLFGMIGLGKPDSDRGIYSATSANGVTFVMDPGPLVRPGGANDLAGLYDPTVVALPDGRYRMYYGGQGAQSAGVVTVSAVGTRVDNPLIGAAVATSAGDPRRRTLAPDSIATLWGERMTIDPAKTLVNVSGRSAQLYYVSATQINLVIPGDIQYQTAHFIINGSDGRQTTALAPFEPVAPALFTLDMSGTGEVAARDAVTFQPGPFQIGRDDRLIALFATGIRYAKQVKVRLGGVEVEVLYAGPQTQYQGLDQVNVRIPAAFAARGWVPVEVEADGKRTNAGPVVTIQ